MTLTVRLDEALEAALLRYCQDNDITKSLVVQQSLAAYLVGAQAVGAAQAETAGGEKPAARSAAFVALERAGLLGTGTLAPAPADKAAVRRRVAERLATRRTARPAPGG